MKRGFAGVIAVVGWLAIGLEFYLTLAQPRREGVPVTDRVIRFFSYFTILTNLLVAIATTTVAFFPKSRFGKFFSRPTVETAVAVYITIVGVVYSLLLRESLTGLWAVANHAVHDVIPIAFVVYWLLCTPKAGLKWADPAKWLVYPILYFVYSLIHGAYAHWYPYDFADMGALGYAVGLRNAGLVLVSFFVLGIVFVAVGRTFSRTAKALSN